ncbi:MAG: lipoprotein insertase outer membrane protein LolB [Leptothrix sp. (in: b-proteobacteria)]
MRRRSGLLACCLALALGLSACQSTPPAPPDAAPRFAGRLAIRVEGDADRSFSASFELHGSAQQGWLSLSSALGTQLGRAEWSPQQPARLLSSDGWRRYDNLDDLTTDLTGQPLPIAAWFDWLDARAWPKTTSTALADASKPGFNQLGWAVDTARVASGLVVATRDQPPPRVTVRVKLDLP